MGQVNVPTDLERSELLAEKVDRREFIDLLKRMLTMDQERRITPSEALNHPFVTMSHMADYAHCSNVKNSARMMEICKRPHQSNNNANNANNNANVQTQLMANIVPRSNGNVTLTFNNQLSRGLPVREARSTAYDAHLQPGALVPFPMAAAAAANYQPLPSPAKHVVVQQAAQIQPPPLLSSQPAQQYVPVTMVEQNGRQMLAAVQASWPASNRQMTLVPSWPQLSQPSAPSAAAAADNILQPLFAAAASEDWRRPLIVDGGLRLQDQAVFPAVVYDRVAAAAAASSRSYQGSKRSTKNSNNNGNPPPAHSGNPGYSSFVKKEQTQLSPVKKRIKENKDHYYDTYQRSPPEVYRGLRGRNGAITIHDTPPLAHSGQKQSASRKVPEVITISDSDDEDAPKKPSATVTSATSVKKEEGKTAQSTPGQNSSECPSVMPLTPSQDFNLQSTPCTSRSNLASCVTVNGDSDEDFQRTPVKNTPIKTEPSMVPKKNRLLKAQSEWSLSSSLKEEDNIGKNSAMVSTESSPNNSAYYPSSRNSIAVDDKDLLRKTAARQQQEFLEQQQILRDREIEFQVARERKRERDYAAAQAAAVAVQRERERERDLQVSIPTRVELGPPVAHQGDYATAAHHQVVAAANQAHHQVAVNQAAAAAAAAARVEYIQPPAAHSQGPTGPPQPDVLTVHRDFYAAAPPTVYVTTAAGKLHVNL